MKVIENIEVKPEIESYVDALYTILTAAGMFAGPEYMLFGMTGMAFKLISHKNIISPSRYMYHLELDSWKAVDRIGIYNEIYSYHKENPTFPLYQRKATERIKESIDRGVAVIFWDPGHSMFAVIYGYDDEDEVFFYKDRYREHEQILLYSNLGKVQTSFWLCQVLGDKVEKDVRDIYIDSLEFAINDWESPNNVPEWTKDEYASGKLAYDFMIRALDSNDFSPRGTLSTINVAVKSKESISLYLNQVAKEFPQIQNAVIAYKNLADIYKEIDACLAKMYHKNQLVSRSCVPDLTRYLKEAKRIEDQGISELKVFLKENLYNKYIDFYDVQKYSEE